MCSFRLYAVILGHIAFAIATWLTWAMGQQFAPEIMMSQAVLAPFIMGVVGIWVWYGFWSAKLLRGEKPRD